MLYLQRSSSDGVCWCSCPEGIAEPPGVGQESCPWCGCGWLFSCLLCRKAFTFARAVEVDLTPDLICRIDRGAFEGDGALNAFERVVAQEAERRRRDVFSSEHLKHFRLGEEYVYLDGIVLPSRASARSVVRGRHGLHRGELLQVLHRDAPDAMRRALDRPYWERARVQGAMQ